MYGGYIYMQEVYVCMPLYIFISDTVEKNQFDFKSINTGKLL